MNNYEILFIIKGSLEDEAKEEAIKRYQEAIVAGGGNIEKTDKWGMRKFAYPINHMNEGYYVLINFSAPSELPKELDRQMRISDDIVRSMIVKKA
jgi:small subunit ribosomal protein S6